MIAKINNGTSLFGAVQYNREKVEEGHARVISGNKMLVNMSGDPSLDLHLALKSFENYLLANRKTEKPVVHISLNPDPKDQLSDEQYGQIAADYMEKMGFGNQPFIVYKHEDIERHHLHIVTVRVDENGKKISDSYEKLRSMDTCRELEKKYRLHPALKKDREFGENFIRKIDYERGDIKRQISNTARSILQAYSFQSLGEYNALLSCYNIDVKQVKGVKFDREYNGIVYAAKNDRGEIVSNPFKSSLFGKAFGYEGLVKTMKNCTEIIKEKDIAHRSETMVAGAVKAAKSMEDFTRLLKANNMDIVFRKNDTGRIYGITFIDHENRVALNGSRLGKEFSANAFNDWLNEGKKPEIEMPAGKQVPAFKTHGETPVEPVRASDTSVIEEALGLFDIKPQGEDYGENDFAWRMRKKKKRRNII